MVEYTKLSEALEALEARRHLRPKVEAFLAERGVGLPWGPALENGKPLAVLFRQVATPNYETLRFLSIASGFDMQPVILEFTTDRLAMENVYKKSLVCTPLVEKVSTKGHVHFRRRWVCPPDGIRPQVRLSEMSTELGENLIDFHHRAFDATCAHYGAIRVDASDWFSIIGRASRYYPAFMSLFCSHAILFESYSYGNGEGDFTRMIVDPSFDEATTEIGAKPLIVPINPTGIEDAPFWVCYPKDTFL